MTDRAEEAENAEEAGQPIGAGIATRDLLELHERAVEATGRIVAAVRPGHMSLPTPCREWDVRALVTHLVEGNTLFARAAAGAPADGGAPRVPEMPTDLDAATALPAYQGSASALVEAWRRPGVAEQMVSLPFGDLPGRLAVELHFADNLVHGWDLATATGQDATLEPDLAEAAYRLVTAAVQEDSRGPGGAFGPEIRWPPDAPVHERLVAFLGRRPDAGVRSSSSPA